MVRQRSSKSRKRFNMRTFGTTFFTALMFSASLYGQAPAPAAVLNPASNIPTGHFNWGIPQGSIFVVYPAFNAAGAQIGGPLGPVTLAQAPALPLTTNLGGTTAANGTSIKVTVAGATVDCFIVYTSKGQVAAVLPSNTPTGTGTLALTYNGTTGSTPIKVMTTNFGISQVLGSSAGVVTFPNYQLVDSTHSAKPGDVLVIWGTGLGAANSDANIATTGDLKTDIAVLLAGVPANITYRGRSAAPGLDQINFVVPGGFATGCAVSLVIQTGGALSSLLSNTVAIPVMPSGGTCNDPEKARPSSSVLTSLGSKSAIKIAALEMTQQNGIDNTGKPTFNAGINALFLSFSQKQWTDQIDGAFRNNAPSIGSCAVKMVVGNPKNNDDGGPPNATGLKTGATITLTPPAGPALTLSANPTVAGVYATTPTSALPGGPWQASNGTGGADVAPFTWSFAEPSPIVWSNPATLIDRNQAYTVKWTGGDLGGNGYATIAGRAGFGTNPSNSGYVEFLCSAPIAATQFTIPVFVLLNLPGSNFGNLELGAESLAISTLTGFDLALLQHSSGSTNATAWK